MAKRWIYKEVWNNAMNDAERASNAAAAADAKLRALQREADAAHAAMQRAVQNAGSGAGKKELEAASKKLEEQLAGLEEELRLELGRMQAWQREQFDAINADIQDLERRTEAVERNVADLKNQMEETIRRMADEKEAKRQRAMLYSGQLNVWIADIAALHADKLTPMEAEELSHAAELIAADLANGDYEAAIGVAQTKLPVAATLYVRLQELNEEYRGLLEAACYGESMIHEFRDRLADAEQNRTVLPETRLEYDGQIDYWSEGGFAELTAHIESSEAEERQAEECMDLEAMTDYVNRLPQILRSLGECRDRAVRECTLSHYCELQAYNIHEELTRDSAWECEDYGFEDDDRRRSLTAVYSDGSELTATIVVLPEREVPAEDWPEQNVYLVHLCDGETVRDAVYCRIARDAVYARLAKVPLHPGSGLEQRAATSSPSVQMFQQHTRQQTEDMKKERLPHMVQTENK